MANFTRLFVVFRCCPKWRTLKGYLLSLGVVPSGEFCWRAWPLRPVRWPAGQCGNPAGPASAYHRASATEHTSSSHPGTGGGNRARIFKRLWSPGIDLQGINSASLWSLAAGRYDKPIPPRFLASIDSLKIPALFAENSSFVTLRSPSREIPGTGIFESFS